MRQQSQTAESNIVHIEAARTQKRKSYRHFGALIGAARRDAGDIHQSHIEKAYQEWSKKEALAKLCIQLPKERKIKPLTAKTYGKLERNEQSPKFDQLLVLYIAMTAGCGIDLSGEEQDFIDLARQKIEAKTGQYREKLTEQDWLWLAEQVATANGDLEHGTRREQLRVLVTEEEQERRYEELQAELEQEQRAKTLADLTVDTSHIIGRDDYCRYLLSFVLEPSQPRKKVIAISAMTGVGKSSVFKLLRRQFLASQDESVPQVIACEFLVNGQETSSPPQEWFDRFLACVYNVLEPKQKEMATLPPVEKRIQRTLQAIARYDKPLAIFLDDAQRFLERDGEWCKEWKQFLYDFMKLDHQATLYVATREWPIWQERETVSYLHHTELPAISMEIGIQLWHNLGFSNESEEVLRRATELCGFNPRMMELVAQLVNAPDFAFDWDEDALQGGLARFVEHPHLAGVAPLLEDIIGRTLSDEAKHLLKILAFAPVPLPPPLVLYVAPHAKQHIHELVRASLLAKRPDRLLLLPLVAESVFEHTAHDERVTLEESLANAYQHWLQAGKFRDEAEQASVVAELILLYLQHHRLIEAAELLISSGWLAYQFGHGVRLARVCQEVLTHSDWKQSPQQELAAHILYDRLAAFRGEKVTTAERAKRYQMLYQKAQENGIHLAASTITHLLQFIVFHLADMGSFQEAESLIKAHLDQVKLLREQDPFTYASFLYCKAYLYGRWGKHEAPVCNDNLFSCTLEIPTQARGHLEEAVELFADCIALLKDCERVASPLQRSRAKFKRARRLNNYAYYAKMVGADPGDIERALEESISLKRRGYASPGSLAIAYGEYAQHLATIGHYQDAFPPSDQALQEGERLVQSGFPEAESELAVLQVERGELHLLVGDVDEAKRLFSLALPHLANAERRKIYYERAETGLQTIAHLETTLGRKKGQSLRGQLDHRWLSRYKHIADYDMFDWLAQAGPFTSEEQEQWNKLIESGRIEDLKQLMQNTLQRELSAALTEQRVPTISYPAIPIVTIKQKMEDCFALKREIEKEEPNRIVKRLYLSVLDEQIAILSMVEATCRGDGETFASYNRRLFPMPTAQEMDIAVGELLKVIDQGLRQVETKPLSREILKRLQQSMLVPSRYEAREQKRGEKLSLSPLLQQIQQEQATIPIDIAAQFLENQIRMYGFAGWKVKVDGNAISEFVEANTEELVLPAKDLTPKSLLAVFAHEVECHVLRHANGSRSKLALLGHGLAGYSPIEEALAVRYTALAQGKQAGISWLGTLAIGLASGVSNRTGKTIQPFNYYELFCLLRDYRLLKQLQQGKEEQIAQVDAHRFAQNTCLRIWRGVPAPFSSGVCSVKDNTYLHGVLQLDQYLEQHEADSVLEHLSVGCMSTEHLTSCYQLGITKPVITNKQLAMQDTFLEAILNLLKNR